MGCGSFSMMERSSRCVRSYVVVSSMDARLRSILGNVAQMWLFLNFILNISREADKVVNWKGLSERVDLHRTVFCAITSVSLEVET